MIKQHYCPLLFNNASLGGTVGPSVTAYINIPTFCALVYQKCYICTYFLSWRESFASSTIILWQFSQYWILHSANYRLEKQVNYRSLYSIMQNIWGNLFLTIIIIVLCLVFLKFWCVYSLLHLTSTHAIFIQEKHLYTVLYFIIIQYCTINKGLKGHLGAQLLSCVDICAQSDNKKKIAENNNLCSTLPNEPHPGYQFPILGNKQAHCVYVRAITHKHSPPSGYCRCCYDNCSKQDKGSFLV